jgi:hypothetical protein
LNCTLSALAGCVSSTKLVTSWSEPDYTGEPFQRVLVVAHISDELQRRSYEQHFVQQISNERITGIAGHSLMPNTGDFDEESELRAAVRESGADAVLLAKLVGVEQKERYVPPRMDYVPSYGYGYGFYDYYGMSYRSVYRPGYTTVDTVVRLETTVFATDTEKMVWAGATESFNPSSAQKVITENADLIIASMKKARLL